MTEDYTPSSEEMADAEGRIANTIEGVGSVRREELSDADKELLGKCHFTSVSYNRSGLEGTLEDGKQLTLRRDQLTQKWEGSLDGQGLSQEEAQQYFDKYYRVAAYERTDKEMANAKEWGAHLAGTIHSDESES